MATLTYEQVYVQARAAGLSPAQAVIATAIAKGESGFNPNNLGDTTIQTSTWGPSIGLWQIRSYKPGALAAAGGSDKWRDPARLRDPGYNAAAMYAISGKGTNWQPWSIYTSGAYKKYLGAAQKAGAKVEAALRSAGTAVAPVKGAQVSTGFGVKGALWSSGAHTGVDYAVPVGTPVYAARSGTVVAEGTGGGAYGTWVKVRSAGGLEEIYGHLSAESVTKGQTVMAGQRIGKSGATGNATGPHLHYEVRKDGKAVNPASVKIQQAGWQDWLIGPGSNLLPDNVLEGLVGPGAGFLWDKGTEAVEDGVQSLAKGTVDAVNETIIKPAWRAVGDLVIKGGFMTFGFLLVAAGAYRLSQQSPTVAAAGRVTKKAAGAPARAAQKGATLAATRGASAGAGAAAKPAPKPAPKPKPPPAASSRYPEAPPF